MSAVEDFGDIAARLKQIEQENPELSDDAVYWQQDGWKVLFAPNGEMIFERPDGRRDSLNRLLKEYEKKHGRILDATH